MNSKFEIFFAQDEKGEDKKLNVITAYKLIQNTAKNCEVVAAVFETTLITNVDGKVAITDGFKVETVCEKAKAEDLVKVLKRMFGIETVYVRESSLGKML